MIRLAILASANGTNAQAIIEAARDGRLDARIPVVLTNKEDAGVIARARNFGIPVEVVPSKGHRNRAEYDALVVETLRKYDVDTVALAGWMRILSEVFVNAFQDRILNLHPALLPSFKGATAIADAYEHGVRVTGCSVHLVTPELDAGPVIIQAAVPVNGTVDELEAQIHRMEHRIFPQALQWFAEGRISVWGHKINVAPASERVKKIDYIEGCIVSPPLEEKI
ncbi:MAG: phosphoribosylglycinamide formyltransferase [Bacteroidaceae bacterium]|jgi:phosphoribosylglycinamide formyltransferase-1|nr:phosphoribosylglycinamide formyltransferase [Bacteroidaceae bacterium]